MAPVVSLFGMDLPSYAVMIAAGYLCGLFAVLKRRRAYDLSVRTAVGGCLLAGAGAFIGGKAFFVIQGLPIFLRAPGASFASFWAYVANSGLVYYGGMIGCLCFVWLGARWLKTNRWELMDALLPSLPLAQAFGRVGCFLAGCCYGVPSALGVYMATDGPAPAAEPLFPVQLCEATGSFLIFLWLYRFGCVRRAPGAMLGRYLLAYGALRFFLEFVRGDAVRGSIGSLSVAQWFSVGATIAGAVFIQMAERARQDCRDESGSGQRGIRSPREESR